MEIVISGSQGVTDNASDINLITVTGFYPGIFNTLWGDPTCITM